MERLPVELIANIFSHLDVKNFLRVSEVCRRFSDIVNTQKFMSKILFNIKDVNVTRKYKNVIVKNLNDTLIEKYKNRTCDNKFDSVTELIISEGDLINYNSFIKLINNFQHVVKLQIEGIKMHEENICPQFKLKLPNLQVINFFYTTNSLLSMFMDIRSQLKVFKVCLIPHIDMQAREKCYEIILTIMSNNAGSLDKLNLYEVNFEDSFLERMPMSLRLKSFSLSFCCQTVYTPSHSLGFRKFIESQRKSLEKFKIRTFDHIDEEKFSILATNATNLKSMNIIICPHCEWNEINLANFQNLNELKIEFKKFCSRVESNIENFILGKLLNRKYHQIRRLKIVGMFTCSDEIIFGTISSFPNLELLEIQYAIGFKTKHVHLLKDKLKFLKKINLNYCEFLDNCRTIMC